MNTIQELTPAEVDNVAGGPFFIGVVVGLAIGLPVFGSLVGQVKSAKIAAEAK